MNHEKTLLYLDIETIPGETMPSLDEISAPDNYKDETKILAYKQDNQEQEYRKQALQSYAGRIICIGYAINDEDPKIIAGTEGAIIKEFDELLCKVQPTARYIGHNIKSFDLKFLQHRLWKYSGKHNLPSGRYTDMVIDTMVAFGCLDWKDMTSLDNIAKFFGLGVKTGKGSDIYDMWKFGELEKIYDYCKNDVSVVREVAKKMRLI